MGIQTSFLASRLPLWYAACNMLLCFVSDVISYVLLTEGTGKLVRLHQRCYQWL
jgi:hypothetical protein